MPDESIDIFNGTFLPRGIGISEIDLGSYGPGDPPVTSELRPVVRRDGPDHSLVWHEQMNDGFSHFPGVLAMLELSHQQHAGASFDKCDDGSMPVFPDDGVHLEVSEPLSVGLRGPFRDADPVGNGHAATSDRPFPVLEAMAAVLVEGATLGFVPAYPAIDGLMGDVYAVQGQMTGDLFRRPLLLGKETEHLIPHLLADGMVAWTAVTVVGGVLLCRLPVVVAVAAAVASHLTGDRAGTDSYRLGDSFFLHSFLE